MSTLLIRGGHVVDPANEIDGVRDLWIADGKIAHEAPDSGTRPDRTIDARGLVVMPGGVDVHCHIAGSKVNAARAMRPEDKTGAWPRHDGFRSGTTGGVPSTFVTGYQYAGLGYTTAVDAAIAPLGARHAHHELRDTPILDKAMLVLMGNNHFVMDAVRDGARERLRDYTAWLLNATRAFGMKVVNPGGIEQWKGGHGRLAGLNDTVDGFDVTPRAILTALAETADALRLPHPIHFHGLRLGLPGNSDITAESMDALDGRRGHLAHIQFHSYAGDETDPASIRSDVPRLVDLFNRRTSLSLDVGQVLFGETTAMTADGGVGRYLAELTGRKWYSQDVEAETGCGVVPITYDDKNFVHALQWAIGLEWFLLADDPWRTALSTDHPNGGSFLAYPRIIALLMSRNLRDEALARLPEKARERCHLADIGREFTLSEIAIITRAAPARILGLANKGHLGPGADADVTIYAPDDDRVRMFSIPRYVLKSGEVIIDDGALRAAPEGRVVRTEREFDPSITADLKSWFDREVTIRLPNFAVRPDDTCREEFVVADGAGGES